MGARLAATAVAVSLLTATACGGNNPTTPDQSAGQSGEDPAPARTTATVAVRDLVETETLAGTLGFGETRQLPTNTTGIVTALPEEGAVVGFGDALFEVNGLPVVLLEGATPQHRPFEDGMADGPDVTQFEQNLVDLGYAADLDLTVDEEFTDTTADAIEAMFDQLGITDPDDDDDDIRRVELGLVVFSPTAVRVGGTNVEVGASITPAVSVLNVTDTEQAITIALDANDRALLDEGTTVTVELPGGGQVPGEVVEVADVATRTLDPATGEFSDPVIAVEVRFTEGDPAEGFDAAPVDVIVTETVTAGVLSVPAAALIALAEGGYAVEVVDGATTRLVGVEIGTFVDDIVQVSGELAEGDEVVIPG
jgi:hypothetical protein